MFRALPANRFGPRSPERGKVLRRERTDLIVHRSDCVPLWRLLDHEEGLTEREEL